MAAKTYNISQSDLIDIEDEIDTIRYIAEAVWMALGDMGDNRQRSAVRLTQDVVTDRLEALGEKVSAMRGAPPEASESKEGTPCA